MAEPWLVVPTRGDRPALLQGIVDGCGLRPDRVVVVATDLSVRVPPGCRVVFDLAPTNIQRWWNAGLRYAAREGATHALVVNDDVRLSPATVPAMLAAMARDGSDLAWAGTGMTGWAWMLRLGSMVRPDERFRWWYGDNDLFVQARKAGGVSLVPEAEVVHVHPNETTTASPALQELAAADAVTFAAKWGP